MRLVIDSSVFVAAFREQEPCSQEAFRLVSQLEKGKHAALLPVTVILEVVAAIRRRTASRELAKRVGEKLLAFPKVSLIDITAFRMAYYLDLATESGLSGMDVVVAGVAQEFDVPLLTLDQELMQRAMPFAKILDIREIS